MIVLVEEACSIQCPSLQPLEAAPKRDEVRHAADEAVYSAPGMTPPFVMGPAT